LRCAEYESSDGIGEISRKYAEQIQDYRQSCFLSRAERFRRFPKNQGESLFEEVCGRLFFAKNRLPHPPQKTPNLLLDKASWRFLS
jgi:hypothetical protein